MKKRTRRTQAEDHATKDSGLGEPEPTEEEAPAAAKKYERTSVQRHAGAPTIRDDFARITETVFNIDMADLAARIEKSLKVGTQRSEHGILHKAVDNANVDAYDAWRLALAAKVEFDRWELANRPVIAKLWAEAEEQLVLDGAKKGASTNKAIEHRIMTLHPEEWLDQETKRAKYDATVKAMERLAKEAGDRPASLRVMLDKLRG